SGVSFAAIVGGDLNVEPGQLVEPFQIGTLSGIAGAVTEGGSFQDWLCRAGGRAEFGVSQCFAQHSRKRRIANAATDAEQVLSPGERESVAQRSPQGDFFPTGPVGHEI